MFKTVILAGGKGERLRPLTNSVPKSMIKINSKPFLHYLIELLKGNQITNFVFCVGYLKEKIMDDLGDGSRFGIKIEYSIEKDFLGTGGALKNAKGYLPDRFMLLYGDSYLPIDYAKLNEFCLMYNQEGVVVCYDNNEKIAENNISIDKTRMVTRYNKRNPDKDMNYLEAGVLVLKKEVLNLIPEGRAVSLEEEVFPILIKEKQLLAYPVSQRFYDIGTSVRLRQIEEVLA